MFDQYLFLNFGKNRLVFYTTGLNHSSQSYLILSEKEVDIDDRSTPKLPASPFDSIVVVGQSQQIDRLVHQLLIESPAVERTSWHVGSKHRYPQFLEPSEAFVLLGL